MVDESFLVAPVREMEPRILAIAESWPGELLRMAVRPTLSIAMRASCRCSVICELPVSRLPIAEIHRLGKQRPRASQGPSVS